MYPDKKFGKILGEQSIMNMYKWIDTQIYQDNKKPFPLLSYPSVQMLYVTVKELVNDSTLQALGMKMIADAYDMPASTAYPTQQTKFRQFWEKSSRTKRMLMRWRFRRLAQDAPAYVSME